MKKGTKLLGIHHKTVKHTTVNKPPLPESIIVKFCINTWVNFHFV